MDPLSRIALSIVCLLFASLPALSPVAAAEISSPAQGDGGPWVLRAFGEPDDRSLVELARRFDHLGVYPEKGMLLVHADTAQDWEALTAAGLRVEIDLERSRMARRVLGQQARGVEIDTIPGFDCYRTVEEMLATGAAIAAEHPGLAEWTDIGDSWQKLNPGPGIPPGWDIMALRLTNEAIVGDKPALLVTGSTHAREYTTAELVTRFGEMLIDRYGVDADVTWLLDHHEIHLILVYNPDGRKQAETGDGNARKNQNNNFSAPVRTCAASISTATATGTGVTRSATARARAPARSPSTAPRRDRSRRLRLFRRTCSRSFPTTASTTTSARRR